MAAYEHSTRNPRLLLAAGLLAGLCGCQTPAPRVQAPDAPPLAAVPALDPSFDWHVLLVAPFGSVLKDIPLSLHEVLLFRDRDPGAAASEDGECYAADTAAPRFFASVPDEYLLCFKQDRLSRIHATVRLPDGEAPALFSAACAGWLKNAANVAAGAASAAGATAASDVPCEGRDGGVHFNAGLEEQPEAGVSITLESVPDP